MINNSQNPVIFDSAAIYVDTATTNRAKIVKIDAIISALEDAALKSAGKANLTEYSLDDGQIKIRTMYRSTAEIMKAINDFEKIKQMYINRINGRVFRMVDSKNFTNRNNSRNGF